MSDWRHAGTVPYELWRDTILAFGGPDELASRASYDAAGDLSALALAIAMRESRGGVEFNNVDPSQKNPFGLRPRGKPGYQTFASWTDAVKELYARITDPTYAYAPTETLEQFVHVYSPDSDNHPGQEAAYVATIRTLWQSWGVKEQTSMEGIVFGKVPYPDVIESHLPASNPYVQEHGAPRDEAIEGVFWHLMVGSWEGTNNWFHAGRAATAYGVSVKAMDGHGGRIYEWIARNNGWYGESSGPAIGPYGDGAKLIAKVGVHGVNPTTKAIEISGKPGTPLDPESRLAIVKITAFFADRRGVPWNQFPIIPGEDRSIVIWHNEITGLVYKTCPDTVIMNETPALIVQTANYMKQFQQPGAVVVKPPQYAKSDLPDWWNDAIEQSYPTDQSENGVKFYVCRRNFVAKEGTRRISAPDGSAARSGPNLKLAEKVHGERYVVNGKSRWILTNDGHYVSAGKLSPPAKIGG